MEVGVEKIPKDVKRDIDKKIPRGYIPNGRGGIIFESLVANGKSDKPTKCGICVGDRLYKKEISSESFEPKNKLGTVTRTFEDLEQVAIEWDDNKGMSQLEFIDNLYRPDKGDDNES